MAKANGRVSSSKLSVTVTKVTTQMIRNMASESLHGPVATSIKESTEMMREMALER